MFHSQRRVEGNGAFLAGVRTDDRDPEYEVRRGYVQGPAETAGEDLLENEAVEPPGARMVGDDDGRPFGRNVLQPGDFEPEPVVDEPVEEAVPGALPGLAEQPLRVPEFGSCHLDHLGHIGHAFRHE